MVSHCFPCQIKYDFIGKLETLYDDAKTVLAQLNADRFINEFPPKKSGPHSSQSENYYKNVSAKTLAKLRQIYHMDFELFGYDPLVIPT